MMPIDDIRQRKLSPDLQMKERVDSQGEQITHKRTMNSNMTPQTEKYKVNQHQFKTPQTMIQKLSSSK